MKTPQFLTSHLFFSAGKIRAKQKVVSSYKCSVFTGAGASRIPIFLVLLLFSAFSFPPTAFSSPVPYSGKIALNGLNVDGVRAFTFALRDQNGTVHWRNGADANASINVPVDRGHYLVLLGGQGMNPLPAGLFLDHPDLYLQVHFFRPDTQQWLHLQPDQRINSTPHALAAEFARNAIVAELAKAVEAGAITKSMLAGDVLADLNRTDNATIDPGSITRALLAADVLADLNATINRSRLAADVLSDLNATITRSRLAADILSDLNATIARSRIAADVLADINATITRSRLAADVLADLNGTVTRSRLAADILADLDRTDTNSTITRSRLAADVRDDLNRTVSVVGTNTGNFEAGLRAYLRPMLKGGIQVTAGVEGAPATLQAPQVDGRFLQYQWYKGGTPIAGATGTQHQISEYNATRDAGDYEIRVSNAFAVLKTKAVLETGSSIKVASGQYSEFTLLLKSDGSLWAMGRNSYGQLGDGTMSNRYSPVKVVDANVTQVAVGNSHSLYLKSDGSLHAMGLNNYGQLGIGNTTNKNSPVQVLASGVTQIAAGYRHSLFLKTNGSLWAMGYNDHGELGIGNTTDKNSPVQVVASGVTQIAAGNYHSLFLKTNGSLHAMGYNNYGQLGIGNTTNKHSPVQVVASGVTQIAAGQYHSLFLKTNGSLFAMGYNANGQLGVGNTTNRYSPVYVVDANEVPGSVIQIAAGYRHSLFVKSDGSLHAMGLNNYGQLGDGSTTNRNSHVQVVASDVAQVAAGYYHSLFLKSDGSLHAMGLNNYGQLGDGSTTNRNPPVKTNDLILTVEQPYVAETAADVLDN